MYVVCVCMLYAYVCMIVYIYIYIYTKHSVFNMFNAPPNGQYYVYELEIG